MHTDNQGLAAPAPAREARPARYDAGVIRATPGTDEARAMLAAARRIVDASRSAFAQTDTHEPRNARSR